MRRFGMLAAGGLAVAVAVAVGGTALASASSGSPVNANQITGCYTAPNKGGSSQLTLQNAGTSCPSGDSAVTWNEQGIQGPQGAQGIQGLQGPAGLNGANGLNGPAGAAGVNGANGLNGPAGAAGVNGGNGANGANGLNGTSGTNGTNGTSVVTSAGVPSQLAACSTGDTDIDLTDGEVYSCVSSAWSDTLESIQGPAGANGTSVATSSTAPTGSCTTGDTDIVLTSTGAAGNGEVWTCNSSGAWQDSKVSIEGPDGPSTAGTGGLDVTVETGTFGPVSKDGQTFTLDCPASHPYVLGGGGIGNDSTGQGVALTWSAPDTNTDESGAISQGQTMGWVVSAPVGTQIGTYVICAK